MRLSTIFACLVLAVAATLPFQPWSKYRESPCAFEVTIEADQSGLVQLYYDMGAGMSEDLSVLRPLVAGKPARLRFPLPYGSVRMLRLDPLDRDVHAVLSDARVTGGSGVTLRAFEPGQFLLYHQIQSGKVADGKLDIVSTPGGTDPQLILELAKPIDLPRPPLWRDLATVFAALWIASAVLEWAWNRPSLAFRDRARALQAWAAASPAWAVLAAAVLGTAAANYPILFAGRSLLAPNLGAALLYGQNPWLPGFESSDVGDAHKTDIAALLWQHLPLSTIEHRAVLDDGELPLWNRYDSSGLPLLGQGQSCFGDPLHMLPVLANGAAWAWELKFLIAKVLFALGIGLCVLACSRSLLPALFLSASVPFLGYFVYRINHPAIFSFCYAPWILVAWLGLLRGRGARSAILWLLALIVANWSEMNSGTAKEAYTLLLSMNLTGAVLVLTSTRSLSSKAALLGGAVAAGGLFTALASPIWLTFYHALKASYTSYNAPLAFQLQPGMALGLFNEAFFRPFQEQLGVINPSANTVVLLGVLWLAVGWRSFLSDRLVIGLGLASLPALALVFGVIPPALVMRIPILGNIQHIDNSVSCALIILFAVLAGVGWRHALERMGTAEGRREAVLVVAGIVLLFAAFLGTAQAVVRSAFWPHTWGKLIEVPAFIHGYGWSLVAGSAALLIAIHRWRKTGPSTAVVLLGLAALGTLHWRESLQVGVGFPEYVVKPTHRVNLRADSPTIDAILAQRDTPFRVLGFHNDLIPGWSIMYGLEGISGPDALMNPYYREFLDTLGVPRVWDWRYIVETSDVARLKPVLDALNVRFYVGYHQGSAPAPTVLRPFLAADMDAYESTTVWPRAYFTDSAAVYEDIAQYASWLKAGDGRPFAAIQHADWVRLSPVPHVSGDLTARRVVPAADYRLTENATSFTVNAPAPGFIVLTEAYEMDNFRAFVNGEKVPYLRINHAFKGVYVDHAGTYQVTFRYFPKGLWTSLKLSIAALVVLLAALCVALFVLKPEPAAS